MSFHERWRLRRLDAVIIVVACVLVGTIVAKWHSNQARSSPIVFQPIGPGTTLSPLHRELGNANWSLLMAMDVGCLFCKRSAPFYRRIASSRLIRSKVQLLAVFPDSPSTARRYLNRLGIQVDRVAQVDMAALGVSSVPTLALINKHGVVSDVWFGLQKPSSQAEILARLEDPVMSQEAAHSSGSEEVSVTMGDLRTWRFHRVAFTVLDTRHRAAFRADHLSGAVNIPFDEVEVRAPIELSSSRMLVIDCSDQIYATCDFLRNEVLIAEDGFKRVYLLRSDGIKGKPQFFPPK